MSEIIASVLELRRDGSPGGKGKHKFVAVPAPGDSIRLLGPTGDLEFWRVEYIEHYPVQIPTPQLAEQAPRVTVVVTFLRDVSPISG
jgi:hypothetical protein